MGYPVSVNSRFTLVTEDDSVSGSRRVLAPVDMECYNSGFVVLSILALSGDVEQEPGGRNVIIST
jgi:hypothetical protein